MQIARNTPHPHFPIAVAVATGAVLTMLSTSAVGQKAANEVVVARVDGEPIYKLQVERLVDRVARGRKVEGRPLIEMQAQALRQLVDRRLILKHLAEKQQSASQQDIDLAVTRVERQLEQQEIKLDDYLNNGRWLGRVDLRDTLAWQIGWQRYLERWLTDENIEKHFQRNRRQFDGTQLDVAQIWFKVEPRDDPQALKETLARAEKLRAEIVSGKLEFAAAAKLHSASPSAAKGGKIGKIGRHAPQSEPFSAVAFQLEAGEVSPPVVTVHGVHLIQCLSVVAGQTAWQQVRGAVEADARRFLFDWVAQQQRPHSQIEFTGAMPHFKPGTSEIID